MEVHLVIPSGKFGREERAGFDGGGDAIDEDLPAGHVSISEGEGSRTCSFHEDVAGAFVFDGRGTLGGRRAARTVSEDLLQSSGLIAKLHCRNAKRS